MAYRIEKTYRGRTEYQADLLRDGKIVGHVERGQTNGFHGGIYRAVVDGREIASGRTLQSLLEDLAAAAQED